MKKLAPIFIWIIIPYLAIAQYSISGKITDSEYETLIGAQVFMFLSDTLYAGCLTDTNGEFSIKNLAIATYELKIIYPGYTPIEQQYQVQNNSKVEFIMVREMSVELDDVEIVADRSKRVQRTATGQIFYLSEKAKNSGDPYRALREVPRLISNEGLQTVTMEDGSKPLILINGNSIHSGINPIDPKDILSIEVMDVVNARYLRTGARNIINIRLKEKKNPYLFFETMTRHDIPLRLGMGALYFEIGNSKYSLYTRSAVNYIYDDQTEYTKWQQQINTYYKRSEGEGRSDNNSMLGEILFKWMMTEKDYFTAHIYATNKREKNKTWGQGSFETDTFQDFKFMSANRDKSDIITGSLYHKHNFTSEKNLETTLAINKNNNTNEGERNEDYPQWLYRYLYEYKNKRTSGSLNIDYSWEWENVNSLNIGSETNYINDHIDQVSENHPVFFHRKWEQYVYLSFSSKYKNLYYMGSAGIEGFWLTAGKTSNRNIKPRAAFSGTYTFNTNNSLQMNYTLTNQAPEVGQLNPYNTSTDSLVISTGNPYLLPVQTHKLSSSYTFNYSGWYISPGISYNIYTDVIEPFGFSENGIYTSSYQNAGKYKNFYAGGSINYRIRNWGNISAATYHHVDYFTGQNAQKSFSCYGSLMGTYKKWTFNAYIHYQNYLYSAISKTINNTPDESLVQLIYNFTKNFYISAALQYFTGTVHTDVNTYDGSYYAFTSEKMLDKSIRPWILIRYTLRKNDTKKIKLNNKVTSKEKGISL